MLLALFAVLVDSEQVSIPTIDHIDKSFFRKVAKKRRALEYAEEKLFQR